MESQVLHTVWCYISGEAAGEIWIWSDSWEWNDETPSVLPLPVYLLSFVSWAALCRDLCRRSFFTTFMLPVVCFFSFHNNYLHLPQSPVHLKPSAVLCFYLHINPHSWMGFDHNISATIVFIRRASNSTAAHFFLVFSSRHRELTLQWTVATACLRSPFLY